MRGPLGKASCRQRFHWKAHLDATATIEHLGPDEKRILHAYHPDRELGKKFEIAPPYDDNREITVTLEPLAFVTGRLLEDGQPEVVGKGIGKSLFSGWYSLLRKSTAEQVDRF